MVFLVTVTILLSEIEFKILNLRNYSIQKSVPLYTFVFANVY